MRIGNLTIIGLGLIGGSIAKAVSSLGLARSVTAYDIRREALSQVSGAGAVDRTVSTLEEACDDADMVILSVPVLSVTPLAVKVHDMLKSSSLITDVSSTKSSIVSAMDALPRDGAAFVGGHPIAGTENSGFNAARKDLFQGTPFIITPTQKSRTEAVTKVKRFWEALGCRIYNLSAEDHDRIFALISHLPHITAYALVNAVVSGMDNLDTIQKFTGGGFRDFTRIAASDPVMWRDICLDNRRYILHAIDLFEKEISFLKEILSAGDGETLHKIFNKSRNLKRKT